MTFFETAKQLIESDLDVEINEDGMATIEYAGTPLLIQVGRGTQSVGLYARLGPLDQQDPHAGDLALDLLSENLTTIYGFGVQYAFDESDNQVLLTMYLPAPVVNEQYWSDAFRTFAVSAEYYRERFEEKLRDVSAQGTNSNTPPKRFVETA